MLHVVFIPWVHKLHIIITYITLTTWVSGCVLALGRVVALDGEQRCLAFQIMYVIAASHAKGNRGTAGCSETA